MASGTLIAESLPVGATLAVGVPVTITKVFRASVGDEDAGQPSLWTFIEFELADDDAPAWAASLSTVLDVEFGWYCDFRTATETFVVFAGCVFRYRSGDVAARAEVEDYARAHGVPDAQLDWPEA